jgi:hypothetical protein
VERKREAPISLLLVTIPAIGEQLPLLSGPQRGWRIWVCCYKFLDTVFRCLPNQSPRGVREGHIETLGTSKYVCWDSEGEVSFGHQQYSQCLDEDNQTPKNFF